MPNSRPPSHRTILTILLHQGPADAPVLNPHDDQAAAGLVGCSLPPALALSDVTHCASSAACAALKRWAWLLRLPLPSEGKQTLSRRASGLLGAVATYNCVPSLKQPKMLYVAAVCLHSPQQTLLAASASLQKLCKLLCQPAGGEPIVSGTTCHIAWLHCMTDRQRALAKCWQVCPGPSNMLVTYILPTRRRYTST